MKPLTKISSKTLLDRFSNATESILNRVTVLDPQTISVVLSVQDSSRDFDWIDLNFEVSGVSDALLVDQDGLSNINMESGISIIYEEESVGLCVSQKDSIKLLKKSPLYLVGKTIKYEELPFSH